MKKVHFEYKKGIKTHRNGINYDISKYRNGLLST